MPDNPVVPALCPAHFDNFCSPQKNVYSSLCMFTHVQYGLRKSTVGLRKVYANLYTLLECQQLNSIGFPVAQLAAYLTWRVQKSLHSAGLPAAHLYWIPSSCISNFESAYLNCFYAEFTQSLRRVYGMFTQCLRRVCAMFTQCLRNVYARFT